MKALRAVSAPTCTCRPPGATASNSSRSAPGAVSRSRGDRPAGRRNEIACGRGRRLTCTGKAGGGIGKVIQAHRGTASRLLKFVVILVLLGIASPRDAVAQGQLPVPDDIVLVQLVRASISALNQANFTGNYTVLRDLGAPSFRRSNTSAQLAVAFSDLRSQNVELGPLLVVNPVFTRLPYFTERGRLHLSGYFPTRPKRVKFDLWYEAVANRWRLFGLSVNTESAEAASAPPAEPGTTPAAAPKALIDLEDAPGRRATPQPPSPKPRRRP